MPAGSQPACAARAYFRPLPVDSAAFDQRASAAFFAASLRFLALTPSQRDLPACVCCEAGASHLCPQFGQVCFNARPPR
jgi:hypothetical protein